MRAACKFVNDLAEHADYQRVQRVRCALYGSLAATGKGHGTGVAIIFGFMGQSPESIEVSEMDARMAELKESKKMLIVGGREVDFEERVDIDFLRLTPLPLHPNGMHFSALDGDGEVVHEEIFYSIGGGFIATEKELKDPKPAPSEGRIPHPFDTGDDLLEISAGMGCSIADIMLANENAMRPEKQTRKALDAIWVAMQECVQNGIAHKGILPGGLKVKRRANHIYNKLIQSGEALIADPLSILDWVGLYALAVNEENAGGGRVVTAPTNGAAGIIPAVLHYAVKFTKTPHKDGVHRFLLSAAAIASLYKKNASISGADVGCQGEVGVACSMAAGALVEYLGGTPKEVENAAEIGMEHNLGLTCDPIGGLVQIPCIERNAMGSVKAIKAARMAMLGEGSHFVSLDKVIKTMWDTGKDMQEKYKETSRGGLAVNVVEC